MLEIGLLYGLINRVAHLCIKSEFLLVSLGLGGFFLGLFQKSFSGAALGILLGRGRGFGAEQGREHFHHFL